MTLESCGHLFKWRWSLSCPHAHSHCHASSGCTFSISSFYLHKTVEHGQITSLIASSGWDRLPLMPLMMPLPSDTSTFVPTQFIEHFSEGTNKELTLFICLSCAFNAIETICIIAIWSIRLVNSTCKSFLFKKLEALSAIHSGGRQMTSTEHEWTLTGGARSTKSS